MTLVQEHNAGCLFVTANFSEDQHNIAVDTTTLDTSRAIPANTRRLETENSGMGREGVVVKGQPEEYFICASG